jgi:hypothetical protein
MRDMFGTHLDDKPINSVNRVGHLVSWITARRFSNVLLGVVDFVTNDPIAYCGAPRSKGDYATIDLLYSV